MNRSLEAATGRRRTPAGTDRWTQDGVQHIGEILPMVLARVEAAEPSRAARCEDEFFERVPAGEPCLVGQA